MGRTRRALIVAVVALVAVAAAVAAYGFGGDAPSDQIADAPVRTAEVSRMTLVDYLEVTGEIGFGEVLPLRYTPPPPSAQETGASPGDSPAGAPTSQPPAGQPSAPPADDGLGLVTWLPAVGTTVGRGQPLLRVDDRPVVLLYGTLPLYRTLKPGTEGADVEQFERNLRELGFTGFTVDRRFTDSTGSVVRQWQRSIGVAPTGAVSPGQVLYSAGAVRVAQQRIRVGDPASGEILGYTGSTPLVTAVVDQSRLGREVKAGTAVSVLVGGKELAGTVRRVAPAPAEAGAGPTSGSAIEADVAVVDQAALDGRQGGVTVRFVIDERKDVLAVPVVALVALAEGGYGVQVADGATSRYVAVHTGLFARGFVEITSGDVTEGTKVIVP